MVDNAQMIITNWGDGFACSVASPQLPGIVAAYDDHPDNLELFRLAVDAGLDPEGYIDVHVQQALDIDGKQFFIRARHDHAGLVRADLASQIAGELLKDAELRNYVDTDSFDDAVIVAALPGDRIHGVMAGADGKEPLTIAMRTPDGSIHYVGMLSATGAATGRRLSDLGLDMSSTVGAIFAADQLSRMTGRHQHSKLLVAA